MVELRFHQRTMWEGWFPEEASGWWEEWMKQADQVLDDEELRDSVYEAQGRRWRTSTDAHDEEDHGADGESGNEVAQPHAHDRASGDGDCTDQPQQGAASSGKVETGLPKAADHDSQGSQPSEALPEGDRQRCETR